MADYLQESFRGGLNQALDATRISKDEYPLLVNARNRYDSIEPINKPLHIQDINFLAGKYQGLYEAGSILIVFIGGKAYWKDYNAPASNFNVIPHLQMSPDVDIIYAELVPTSYMNYSRVPETANQRNTDVKLTSAINSNPAGLIVQDGITQPWIINTDLTARVTQNYTNWSLTNREYVPVGTQMLYTDGILYIINGRLIMRSVTGRPLDFMVNITSTGDKELLEADGGAQTVAHAVDFDVITAIGKLTTDDGSFYVSTKKASYAVKPEFDEFSLIFGEPTFTNRYLFAAGCISPFSFIELLGDNAFVDFNGLRSFNAIEQLKNEGSNSPFSKKLGPIIQGIVQDYTAAINFDNYAIFAVNTIYGRGLIIYDTLLEVFAAIDIYDNVAAQIKQFREIKTNTGRKLFFITQDNKLFEAFGDTANKATVSLYLGDWTTNDPAVEQRPNLLKLVFIDILNAGTVYATSYVDRRLNKELNQPIPLAVPIVEPVPIAIPFGQNTVDNVQVITFNFSAGTYIGWKMGFLLTWTANAKLSHVKLSSIDENATNNITQQGKVYARNREFLNSH